MNTFLILLLTAGALGSYVPSNSRTVGSSQAQEGQFPYQVSIRLSGTHHCGGALLNKKSVLTAAHCILGQNASLLQLNVGTNDVYHVEQQRNVFSYKVHEGYDSISAVNDIAVARIAEFFVWYGSVQPIPLGTNYVGAGVDVVLSGWGFLSYDGRTSQMLQFINTRTYDNVVCMIHNSHMGYPVRETNICTLTKAGEGVCKGDSGGPLVIDGKLVGIMSWSDSCARGTPDVFTRVSSYREWIMKND